MTLSSLAPSLRKPTDRILTEHVLFPDFPERRAELLDAERVHDGVDGRVAVGEDDGDVNEEHRLVAGGAKEGDAVEDVKREPADREEEKNEGERLGELELLAEVAAGVRVASCHLQRDKGEDRQRIALPLLKSGHIQSVLTAKYSSFFLLHIKQRNHKKKTSPSC